MAAIGEWERMRWTKSLLAPERLRLCATAGPAGARAAMLLYQQRRPPILASDKSWTVACAVARDRTSLRAAG